jgi:preprotein translocase subunit SecE
VSLAQTVKTKQDVGRTPSPIERLTISFDRFRHFLHDVRGEMKLVNWPTRSDVWSTTTVVIVTVAFFGVFFFAVDRIVSSLVQSLLHYFKG